MKEELKQFNIDLDTIPESNNLFENISEAIEKMKLATLKDKFEVVLNNNLIENKEKLTKYRTILGCRISYDNLDKNISFIVREDNKPSYEQLEKQLEAYENMRKEIIEFINLYAGESNNFCLDYHDLMKLRNILNKVGGSDETI